MVRSKLDLRNLLPINYSVEVAGRRLVVLLIGELWVSRFLGGIVSRLLLTSGGAFHADNKE